MGSLLAGATYAVLRRRVTSAAGWIAAGLVAAFVGEIIGRLVGLVGPPPINLMVVFVLWQALSAWPPALLWRPQSVPTDGVPTSVQTIA